MSWYCDSAPGHPVHGPYHDQEYGCPLTGDAELFERLSLEVFQAGLSWLIVLKKRAALHQAFDGFCPSRVADYGDAEVNRLMDDAAIIRNRRKILATIENARRLQGIISEHGSFSAWLDRQTATNKDEWVRLFKKTFVFMGGEVVGEFLMSIGRIPGAHRPDCHTQRLIEGLQRSEQL